MKIKQQIIQITIFLATVILSFINFFLLPDIVAVQWNSTGASNFISKNFACIIPIIVNLISLVFLRYFYSKYNLQIETSKKFRVVYRVGSTLLSVVGLIINILFLLLN